VIAAPRLGRATRATTLVGLACLAGTVFASVRPSVARAGSSPLYEQASATPGSDQGSNANYRSYVTRVTPSIRGLQVQVLAFADRLQVFNRTGRTVTIYGYNDEPYARLLADGTVQLNERSPALYLNTSFYASGTPPASTSSNPATPPTWTTVFHTGNFQWHDHRVHWASPTVPPQVKDKHKRTFIWNWTVPITVGDQRGSIAGQLFWTPSASTASIGAYLALGVLAALALVVARVVRSRRSIPPGGVSVEPPGPGGTDTREAW